MQQVEKVIISLTSKFSLTVVAIEDSKDLSEMKLEELQESLEVHELGLKQKNSEKVAEQAL